MDQPDTQRRLAVLIDADNTQPSIVEGLLEEVANYGVASVKRIYGDWTGPHLKGWKQVLLDYAIQPIQQFSYTSGKNATDSMMIIDAMDLLYAQAVNGFCIVSSDSDFTRLSARLREAGMIVYGFGEQKTPRAFVTACDRFIYVENLRKDAKEDRAKSKRSSNELKRDARLVNLLRNAVEDSADENGWVELGAVGTNVLNRAPEFDPRSYGYKKLGDLVRAIDLFEIDERAHQSSPGFAVYVRDRRKRG